MSYLNRKDVPRYDKGGAVFNIISYGAKNDGVTGTCTVTGTNTVTSTTPVFKPADVGKEIYINSAGASGAQFKSTITGYTSSTVVSVTGAVNVSGVTFWVGTNSTAGIQAAIDAAEAAGGGIVTGPPGKYVVSSLRMKANVEFCGTGVDAFTLWSAIATGEVIQSFWPINASTASDVTVQKLSILCIDPLNRATCIADVAGTYTRFKQLSVRGGIFGVVADQSELFDAEELTIETAQAYYQGMVDGRINPTVGGWTKTGSGTTSNTDGSYWRINTLASDATTYYSLPMDSACFARGFTIVMNPPIVASSDGGALPNNSVIVRIDNGSTQRFDLTFSGSAVKLNGGTSRTVSPPASLIRLEVAAGGATATLKVDNAITDTGVAALSSASSAGIYWGDLATTDDSDTYWKWMEFHSCNPIPIGFWVGNGDFFWQSRESVAYAGAGTMTLADNTLTVTGYARFAQRDVGKAITVAGAGLAGANLVTTISAFNTAASVELAAPALTAVSGATVTFNPASAADFTNRISIDKCQFNTGAIQLALDGGNVQSFKKNNFNGGFKQIAIASGVVLNVEDSEFEGSYANMIVTTGMGVQDWNHTASATNLLKIGSSLINNPSYTGRPPVDLLSGTAHLENNYFPAGSGVVIRSDRTGGVGQVSLIGNITNGATLLDTYADIEGVSPVAGFVQSRMSSATSGATTTIQGLNHVLPGSASIASSYGVVGQSTWAGSAASSGAKNYGGLSVGIAAASATLGANYGHKMLAYSTSATTITANTGARVEAGASGGGTNTTNTGLSVKTYATSSSTLTTNHGVYVENPTKTSSTITTNYGIYLESQTSGTTNYAIYSAGGQSYLAGNLGLGQTTPTAVLHLKAGTATANTAPLKFATGTALTTPEDGAVEYHSSHLYFTIGSTRYQLDQQGGSGTVTATGGSLTANAVVLGAGTTDTKVVTGITTDGTSQLNLGVNATTLGKVKLFGSTSGDATIQPAAVAGTSTVVTLPNASSILPIFGQQITFAGPTAARTITLPDAAFTAARTDAAQTFTGTQTFSSGGSDLVSLTGSNGSGFPEIRLFNSGQIDARITGLDSTTLPDGSTGVAVKVDNNLWATGSLQTDGTVSGMSVTAKHSTSPKVRIWKTGVHFFDWEGSTSNVLRLLNTSGNPIQYISDSSGQIAFGSNVGAATAQVDVVIGSATRKGLIVQGAASQTADYININTNGGSGGDILALTSSGSLTLAANATITGRTISTDANGTVGGMTVNATFTKNDTNLRTFAVALLKPTLNTGASNTNTTIDILQIDTTNTATTGLTVNLIDAMYGGVSKFVVDSAGLVTTNDLSINNTGTFSTSVITPILSSSGSLVISSTSSSALTIDSGTTGTVGIGTGTGAKSINLGTGGTGAKTVTLGSTASTSTTNIRAGSGNVHITGGDFYVNGGSALKQNGATSGTIGFTAAATTTSYDCVWPSAQGAAGTTLTNDGSGALSWSGLRIITSISSPTTAAAAAGVDYVYYVTGTTTLTLPTAVGNINRYTVKNSGTAIVTIATTSSQTIDTQTSLTITPNQSVDVVSNNSNWFII